MVDAARARKLADRIKVVVAETLEMRVKDPRLGFITITDARVTGDLQQATVFYTVLGDETARADTAAALESARGVLRSEVGRQTGVRLTPTLTFIADAIPETAAHIEELLAKVAAADAEVHRAAAGSDVRRRGRPVQGAPGGRRRRRRPTRPTRPMTPTADGLVVVDKPSGLTSHDVVARVRRLAGTRKVGHAGTLDPMATGVLVVGVNRATRLLGHLTLTEKAYDATVRLGATTVTDDAEGEVVATADATGVTCRGGRCRRRRSDRRHPAGAVDGERHQGRRAAGVQAGARGRGRRPRRRAR